MSTRWEYLHLIVKTDGEPSQWRADGSSLMVRLNSLGAEGWEVVGMAPAMAKVAFGSQPGANRIFVLLKRHAEVAPVEAGVGGDDEAVVLEQGFYADPEGSGKRRYWTGSEWTGALID